MPDNKATTRLDQAMKCMSSDDVSRLQGLLDDGLPLGLGWGEWEASLLHVAAIHGSIRCMNALLARGATVEARDAQGKTPLHYAIRAIEGNADQVVGRLLEAGADPNATDSFGRAALDWAAWARRWSVADILLKNGASQCKCGRDRMLARTERGLGNAQDPYNSR